MQNFQQEGNVLTLTAPTGGVTTGVPVLIGDLLVIPIESKAATLPFEGKRTGVFTIAKLTTEDFVEGQLLWWDDGNSRLTETKSTHKAVGYCTENTAGSAATCLCLLGGMPGVATP